MVRLVAVAIDDDDVAWLADRLDDDLVRGRGAVGAEVGPLGAERARPSAPAPFLMLPVGSSRLSSPPVVADDSARNRLMP